ncbi:MAG: hypothetical protein MZW92_30415 [Comamonadaceae bacterium]|nr:hypothetical protein [Comamonadaceae bacterium]
MKHQREVGTGYFDAVTTTIEAAGLDRGAEGLDRGRAVLRRRALMRPAGARCPGTRRIRRTRRRQVNGTLPARAAPSCVWRCAGRGRTGTAQQAADRAPQLGRQSGLASRIDRPTPCGRVGSRRQGGHPHAHRNHRRRLRRRQRRGRRTAERRRPRTAAARPRRRPRRGRGDGPRPRRAVLPRASVRAVDLEEAASCEVVVFAAGRNGRPGESRLQLLADNYRVATDIGRLLGRHNGIVIVVSNPVDVLTRVLQQASGLPPSRVIGTGTMLDTARLRQRLAQHLGVDARSVHAQVLGEHGDSEIVHWSAAQVGGRPLRDWPGWTRDDEQRIGHEVKRAAYEIIQRKGVTNHAIGLVTADLIRAVIRDEHRVLTVSRCRDGVDGLDGVSLSLPTLVGRDGAQLTIQPKLDDEETAALQHSAQVLRQAWDEMTKA